MIDRAISIREYLINTPVFHIEGSLALMDFFCRENCKIVQAEDLGLRRFRSALSQVGAEIDWRAATRAAMVKPHSHAATCEPHDFIEYLFQLFSPYYLTSLHSQSATNNYFKPCEELIH